ncbi:hemolysin family protein [Rhodoluna sp. KAS3]|uniref:hemolysin family protein n=1 Tax=Rhodoluna sp. KAS3 TaxID=942880 RepID=UPI0022327FBE|nr:hemolysin family protein [Rhodoluna sp. KAS3]BDS49314.1 membrane protein [Rhodoluna sp. KAS3]
MNDWLMLGVGVLLTIGTGLFVASEFSLLNVERNELEARRSRGEKGLSVSIAALKVTSTHLSSAQLGITLTTLLTGFVAEPSLTKLLTPAFAGLSLESGAQKALSVVAGMTIATIFSFLIGELVPKNMALSSPLKVLNFVVRFQVAFTWVFKFMIRFLSVTGDRIVRMFGIEPKEELSSTRTAEELSSLVRRSASMGALDAQTATLLTKTLALSQLVAADVMTPRPRMHVLDKDSNLQALIEASIKTGHSRFPISDGSADDIIGVAHVKQAAAVPREKRADVPVSAIMAPALRVPETMRLETLMVELRAKGLQLAIVVDEYGGTAGLATLEDLIEELVGELADEHDRAKAGVTRGANSSILFPGLIRPDELREMAIKVPADGAYETVAGFMMSELGRIPANGDEVQIEDGVLRVERMEGRRVDRVRFTPTTDAEGSE